MTTSISRNPTGSSPSDALRGASLAFSKKSTSIPPQTPKPSSPATGYKSTSAGRRESGNGLLTALSAQSTGNSTTQHHDDLIARLQPPNPSFIAAALAASRSGSPNPRPSMGSRQGSVDLRGYGDRPGFIKLGSTGDIRERRESPEKVDSGHIATTNSLISMFEDGGGAKKGGRHSLANKKGVTRSVEELREVVRKQMIEAEKAVQEKAALSKKVSPKPVHLVSRSKAITPPPRKDVVQVSVLSKPEPPQPRRAPAESLSPQVTPRTPSVNHGRQEQIKSAEPKVQTSAARLRVEPRSPRSPPQVLSPVPQRLAKPVLTSPITPPQRFLASPSHQAVSTDPSPDPQKNSPIPLAKLISKQSPTQARKSQPPAPPRPRGSSKPMPVTPSDFYPLTRTQTSESNDVFVSAPTSPSPLSPPNLPTQHRKVLSTSSSPTRYAPLRRPSVSPSHSTMSIDNLTSAIVAGSLATSRLTPHLSGSHMPPPPPRRQKSPRLKQTLRQPASQSDSEDDKKRGHHYKIRKGKHKHHEGSRKKWRDEIRAPERKRYEALWASNRGTLMAPSPSPAASTLSVGGGVTLVRDNEHCVANLVVREIWKRSRLPVDELAEVWDLVDREKRGKLDRQEFVVGTWLIDQRLKGRKIPIRVSDSVWGSANGVRVTGPKIR